MIGCAARDLSAESADVPRYRAMLKEFRQFILRGNVIDLAVAVVIGAAFKAVVDALVADLITPLIAAIGGKPDFSALKFTLNGSAFKYGAFINEILSFLIIAAVIFFLIVKPVNSLLKRLKTEPDVDSETRPCPECLSNIPTAASRCAFCTAAVGPATAG
jgi:large conductance mechanosensitive channel